jgi:hypothetical protein
MVRRGITCNASSKASDDQVWGTHRPHRSLSSICYWRSYDTVGPLSGKTTVAVIVWLIVWYALARRWHARPPVMTSALVATFVLIGVGFVGTFPLFFELFTAH